MKRLDQPCFHGKRKGFCFLVITLTRMRRGDDGKTCCLKLIAAFPHFDAVIYWQFLEPLRQAARPADAGSDRTLGFSEPEE